MYKKVLMAIWFLLMVLLGVAGTYAAFNYPKADSSKSALFNIEWYRDFEPGEEIDIRVDELGGISLVHESFSSAVDGKTTTKEYNGEFTKEEFDNFKKVVDRLNSIYNLKDSQGVFNYSYDNKEVHLNNDDSKLLDELSLIVLEIATNENSNERKEASSRLENLTKIESIENEGYKKITFTKNEITKKSSVNLYGSEVTLEIKDKKIYLNDSESTMVSDFDAVYIVDVDGDGKNEVISRTWDLKISPPTIYYHIYKVSPSAIDEIATVSIMGSTDVFYVKGKDLMVEYEPYESRPGTLQKDTFKIK